MKCLICLPSAGNKYFLNICDIIMINIINECAMLQHEICHILK